MRLKEREIDSAQNPAECLNTPGVISSPPIIDIEAIKHADDLVKKTDTDGFQAFPALRFALTFSLYNFCIATKPTSTQEQTFLERFKSLAKVEKKVSDPTNPLPTIGWEVEVPIKSAGLVNPDGSKPSLFNFFQAIDWYNFNDAIPALWDPSPKIEYAPMPAYTAGVSSRLMCELIKGGFITSLRASTDPQDIRAYLADKLISLHISLGIPPQSDRFQAFDDRRQAKFVFSSIFALAYTSAERFEYKFNNGLESLKNGSENAVDTSKSTASIGRFEIKALEVRDRSVYRLMWDIQQVAAALFEAYSSQGRNQKLADEWRFIEERVIKLFDKKGFSETKAEIKTAIAMFSREARAGKDELRGLGFKKKSVEKVGEVGIGQALRLLIRDKSARIAQIIEETQVAA